MIAAAIAAAAFPALAQQDPHHPPGDSARPSANQPPAGGMDMQAMMRRMMQDRAGMHRMNMMGLMGMSGMMSQMQSGMPVEHAEGHIAFVRAELKITEGQAKLWDDFAAALRANAKQLNDLHAAHAGHAKPGAAAQSPVQSLEMQEVSLAARIEVVRRAKAALAPLYAVLTDGQKKTFGELMMPRMGMN